MMNGDQQEYGEEVVDGNGMQVSNALAGQRASKKRAQDDVKLLANRIALLKLEEKKVSHHYLMIKTFSITWAAQFWSCLFLNTV